LSHATAEYPYAGAVKVREPVARPLDVVAVELLLTAAQAFLVGVLLYLAVGFWEDQGVGLGSVAAILVLLGLAVGGAWLYWLMGGVGWPMAAANTPVALFFGFTLVMGWYGDESFRVGGAPLLLAEVSAVFGVIAGVFVESPRRWRWDQREKLRPGTQVPRVSETTLTLAAQVPRSLSRRAPKEVPVSDLAARIEHSTPPGSALSGEAGAPAVRDAEPHADRGADAAPSSPSSPVSPVSEPEPESELTDAPDVKGTSIEVPEAPEPTMPASMLKRGAKAGAISGPDLGDDEADEGVELPTMIEPKAQRSPWAWAAPPEWNRDEEDDPAGGRSSTRS
jgi:hypothetical protein